MSGYLYRAVFRNSVGSVTSDAARLTVNPISFKVLVGALQWAGPSHGKYQAYGEPEHHRPFRQSHGSEQGQDHRGLEVCQW